MISAGIIAMALLIQIVVQSAIEMSNPVTTTTGPFGASLNG